MCEENAGNDIDIWAMGPAMGPIAAITATTATLANGSEGGRDDSKAEHNDIGPP